MTELQRIALMATIMAIQNLAFLMMLVFSDYWIIYFTIWWILAAGFWWLYAEGIKA